MKSYIVATISGDDSAVTILEIEHDLANAEAAADAIRDELAKWAVTEAGRLANEYTTYDFNWGDVGFVAYNDALPLPPGVRSVRPVPYGDIALVDYDERLMYWIECPQCHSKWAADDEEFIASLADHEHCPDCHKKWQNGEDEDA